MIDYKKKLEAAIMSNLEQERTIRNLNDSLDNIKEINISLELKVREYIEKPNQENVGAAVATEEVNIEKEIMQIRANTTKLRKTNTVENEEENLEEHKDSTKPKEICRIFSQKGWCKYGTKCIYIHEERDDREQGKRNKICYHYSSKGFCRHGDECMYIHKETRLEVCRNFQASGTCRYGERCFYSHNRQASTHNESEKQIKQRENNTMTENKIDAK
eukprot:gene1694-1885_t